MSIDYTPIDCSLHDRLEAAATQARLSRLSYVEGGRAAQLEDVIVDVFTRGSAEFIRTRRGVEIRLDHILALDETVFRDSGSC